MSTRLSHSILTAVVLMAFATGATGANRTDNRDIKAGQNKAKATSQASTATKSEAKPAGTETTTSPVPTQTVEPIKVVTPETSTPLAPASPNAGEQIKWQVISGGGVRGTSASYVLTGTVGQTAAGPGASASYKVNQGFWQSFAAGCCVGVTGNVNTVGSVDLADLSALVNYLTGGGYVPPCMAEANVNTVGTVDLADLSSLVSYLTGGGFVLPSCS
jgi:cytoskeletal protein RodZ